MYERKTNINLNGTEVNLSSEFENLDQLNAEIHKLEEMNANTNYNYPNQARNARPNIIIDYETDLIEPGTDHERTDQYLKVQ